jgi:sulfatase modifying factor 1
MVIGVACSIGGDPTPGPSASASVAASLAPSANEAPAPSTSAEAPAPSASISLSASASASAIAPEEKPPCPPSMTLVGRFCVDTFEAELEVQDDEGNWVAHPHYERPPEGRKFRAVNALGAFPQGYISQKESEAACKESGKRLCTKNEWSRACRGKGYMRYPYGGQAVRGKCSSGKLHLLSKMFKDSPGGYTYEKFNAPELNKEPGWLAKSGEYTGCVSDLGVGDMVGNLHEWVSDRVSQRLIDDMEAEQEELNRHKQPHAIGNGVFMGGFYSTTSELGPGCSYITVAHEPTYHDYSTGFRCCAKADLPPEPPKPPKQPKAPKKQPAPAGSGTSAPLKPASSASSR